MQFSFPYCRLDFAVHVAPLQEGQIPLIISCLGLELAKQPATNSNHHGGHLLPAFVKRQASLYQILL